MAICYECGARFSGDHCDECGWKAEYKCWNCKSGINFDENELCKECGWLICEECGECGCSEERPPSNQEKEDGEDDF